MESQFVKKVGDFLKDSDFAKKNKLSWIITIVTLLLSFYFWRSERIIRLDQETIINALSDTLSTYKNVEGLYVAEINDLVIENQKSLDNLDFKDEELSRLKDMVNELKGRLTEVRSVTYLKTQTVFRDTSSGNDIKIVVRPSELDSSVLMKETFVRFPPNKWIEAQVNLIDDEGANWNISILNEYEFSKTLNKSGFLGLGKREYNVQVKNLNPYTYTSNLRSISFAERQRRWSMGVSIGVGVTEALSGVRVSPYIGIGMNYSLISF